MPKAKAKPKSRAKAPRQPAAVEVIPAPVISISSAAPASDLKIETAKLEDLYLDPANARKHNPKNLESIKASLRNFAQVEPLVVAQDGKIIGGNGRYAAMKDLGWTEARVVRVDLSPSQATALGVALNRTAELAEWDLGTLTGLLDGLRDEDFDLNDLGFSDDDLTALARQLEKENLDTHGSGDHDPDDIPEDAPSVCKVGDLWQVGRHRLLCGDSTMIDHMQRLCGDEKVHAVVTDPPYGVNIVGGNHSLSPAERLKRGGKTIQNDGALDLHQLLADSLGNVATVCRPGAVWYVWAPAGPQFLDFATVLSDMGVWRQTLAWVKDSLVMGHSDYHYRHEVCFYGWSEGKHMSTPDRTQDSVWEVPRPKRSADHPTMKPVELMERCIKNSTIKDNIVLEPFNGSGTTLVACERTGRTCYAMEIDPKYVDSTLRRWSKLTGQDPVLIEGPDED